MGVVPFSTSPPYQSVVFAPDAFSLDAPAVLIVNPDMGQLGTRQQIAMHPMICVSAISLKTIGTRLFKS
jgi:hypothetical protein